MEYKVVIIGLGYIELLPAIESGKLYPTFGFGINQKRIDDRSYMSLKVYYLNGL